MQFTLKSVCLFLLLVATGCRTYGDYDSADAFVAKIREAAEQSFRHYDRALTERDALQRATDADNSLMPVFERFAVAVDEHALLVEEHHKAARRASSSNNILFQWVGPDTNRGLHRLYGAIISDQQVISDRYDEVRRALLELTGMAAFVAPDEEDRRYMAPHFYRRQSEGATIAQILAQ